MKHPFNRYLTSRLLRATTTRSAVRLVACLAAVVLMSALVKPAAVAQPSVPIESVDPEQQRHVDTCRTGLLDPEARDEERRRLADLLLGFDSPQAHQAIVELLARNDRPKVQRVLCDAIGDRARSNASGVNESFVAPLLDLLGAESDVLRSAAAQTLSDWSGAEVPAQLGAIASSDAAPLAKRLAAIDALAPNTHRRDVIAQLIPLVGSSTTQVVERTTTTLASATLEPLGPDAEKWREWWQVRSRWPEEQWLAEQLGMYRKRSRVMADEFASFRASAQQSISAIETQFRSFQHELFRLLPKEQRDARVVEWLGSPLSLTNRTALVIIQARITDEGKRPEGEVLTALLGLMQRATGDTLRESIQIVQTLNAPSVVDPVLGLLDRERDPKGRLLVFAAIGRLESPKAIGALIREIADDRASAECVREAAIALGTITGRVNTVDSATTAEAIEPLKRRFASLAPGDAGMRAALLSAMAGVGTAAFTPELLTAVESDDATILQPALRGLLRIGDASKLSRFRTLSAHADPQVRLAAIEAVASLGTEEADLENILTRLNPAIESNASVRDAAWRGFREFMDQRPLAERIRVTDRLRDTHELELRYLTALADDVTKSIGENAESTIVLERLATTLMNNGKYAESANRWSQLFESRAAAGDADLLATGLRWLEARLRAPTDGELPPVLSQLANTAKNDDDRGRIRDVVQSYLESPEFVNDPVRARTIIAELRVPDFTEWTGMLDDAERVVSEPAASDQPK